MLPDKGNHLWKSIEEEREWCVHRNIRQHKADCRVSNVKSELNKKASHVLPWNMKEKRSSKGV